MKFGWETEKERLIRLMNIPPKKKLEWLKQMHEFLLKASTKKYRHVRMKLKKL